MESQFHPRPSRPRWSDRCMHQAWKLGSIRCKDRRQDANDDRLVHLRWWQAAHVNPARRRRAGAVGRRLRPCYEV